MDHPSHFFNRIRRQKARAALPRQGRNAAPTPVAPAPFPATAAPSANLQADAIPRADDPVPSAVPSPSTQAPASPAPVVPAEAPSHASPGIPPRPARGHALYSQIMRSHDRMGTRHL